MASRQPLLLPLALALALALAAPLQAQPLLVTYGDQAPAGEGDPDYRQVIHLRLPEAVTGTVWLRVFDADTGGAHDLVYARPDTATRYALYAGAGDQGGELLAEAVVEEDADLDDRWSNLLSFQAERGEPQGGERAFRLEIEGRGGDDGNAYDLALSLRERRELPPPGARLWVYRPTVRALDDGRITLLPFTPPGGTVTVGSFDAPGAELELAGAFRSYPLADSGQAQWRATTVELAAEEVGRPALVRFAGGFETPNDASFELLDDQGRPLAFELPVRAVPANGRPRPVVTARPLADCRSVAFDASQTTDPDGDPLTFQWDFGDGQTGQGRALHHRYPEPGSYPVQLRVFEAGGQGALENLTVAITRPPQAQAGPDRVVAPRVPVVLDASDSVPGDRPIARYRWDLGNGTLLEGEQVEYVFPDPGLYRVTLRVEDDTGFPCNAGEARLEVRANAAPLAEAGPDRAVAVDQTLTLDGGASYDVDGTITHYRWDLGDGTVVEGPRVEHTYARPGLYPVELTVRDGDGVDNSLGRDTLEVFVNAPPVPEAGPDRQVAIGEVIPFDAGESRDPDGRLIDYRWDFGDGGQGSGPRVDYAWPQAGEYTVTLTVTDDSATQSARAEDRLTVRVNAPPLAEAGPDQYLTRTEVAFDAGASVDPDGTLSRYDWDFGDDSTGSGPAPVHAYARPGTYRVTLVVTDDSPTIRNQAQDSLTVRINARPIAQAGPDRRVAPGEAIPFDGGASLDPDGDIRQFRWDFGDGTTGEGVAPEHRYDQSGTYRVTLTVADDSGHPEAVDFDEARVVVNAPPVAEAGPDRLVAPGQPLALDGGRSFDSDGTLTSHRWRFDDGQTFDGARPVVTFAESGLYRGELTVTDDSGVANDQARDALTVLVNHAPQARPGEDVYTRDDTLVFDASASTDPDGHPLTHTWDFGDGSPPVAGLSVSHTYAQGGVYPVVLTVDDGTGLANARDSRAMTVTIDRPPRAEPGPNRRACAQEVVLFDGGASRDPEGGVLRYRWDFGDGETAQGPNPTHVYRQGGVYPVVLEVTDDSPLAGGSHAAQLAVTVDQTPLAVAGEDLRVCAGTEVRLDGSASTDADGVVNRYIWDFGDGSQGGGASPVHVYARPGRYTATLTVEGDRLGGLCEHTDQDEVLVEVIEAPLPIIEAPRRAPQGQGVTFDASASRGGTAEIVDWQWDFGDGSTATGVTVEHVYDRAGDYPVTLTVATADRSLDCHRVTARHGLVINAPPRPEPGPPRVVGVDEPLALDGSQSHDPDGVITAWRWDFGDGRQGQGRQVSHRYRQPGTYPLTLTVVDDTLVANNTASQSVQITVNAPPRPAIQAPPAGCPGQPVAFSGAGSRDPDGAIATLTWQFGDGNTAQGPEVSHTYAAPGRYPLTLVADDGSRVGNARAEAALAFHVNRSPLAAAGPNRRVCPGESITFDGSGSLDPDGRLVELTWDFGDGESAAGETADHAYTAPGVYPVVLTVEDDSGAACHRHQDQARVTVNATPRPEAGPDRQGFTGGAHDQLLFEADDSHDPDGDPLAFEWDFGDGTTARGVRVYHGYDQPGDYTVTLTARDDSGLACGSATDQARVVIRSRDEPAP